MRLVRLFNQAAFDARSAWQPSLPLEVALVEAIQPPVTGSAQAEDRPTPEGVKPAPTPAGRKSISNADPQAAPEGAAEAPASGLTLQMVQENWRQVLHLVRQRSPNAEALLKSGRVLGVKDGVLYLGFSEVLKSKMEKTENMDSVRRAFQEVFKMEVPIRCVVTTGKARAIPADIDGDGMVATALRDLGGEIVDIQ
jgi:hypothetical protein